MLKGLLIFQSLIILLMFLAAVMFIIQGLFIQSILYLAFGALFTGYVLSNRKHKPECNMKGCLTGQPFLFARISYDKIEFHDKILMSFYD